MNLSLVRQKGEKELATTVYLFPLRYRAREVHFFASSFIVLTADEYFMPPKSTCHKKMSTRGGVVGAVAGMAPH
jgi:hypothetical protein